MGRTGLGVAAALALVVSVAACSGSSSGSSGSSGSTGSGGSNGSDDSGGVAARSASRPVAGSAAVGTSNGPELRTPGGDTTVAGQRLAPSLILTGSLSVAVRSVPAAAGRAESVVTAVGGRTDADDRYAPRHGAPSATLTLRVPNASVPAVMNRLAGLGHVTNRQLSTRDVTADVADVDSRVTSARSAIRSLRALYAEATKVSDVIRIESTLSQREAELESFEARARSLGGQVALASITLDLAGHRAAAPPAKHDTHRGGFVGGLDRGWHAFTAAVSGLAVGIGAVLPFVVVLLVVGAGVLAVRRRRAGPSASASGE